MATGRQLYVYSPTLILLSTSTLLTQNDVKIDSGLPISLRNKTLVRLTRQYLLLGFINISSFRLNNHKESLRILIENKSDKTKKIAACIVKTIYGLQPKAKILRPLGLRTILLVSNFPKK